MDAIDAGESGWIGGVVVFERAADDIGGSMDVDPAKACRPELLIVEDEWLLSGGESFAQIARGTDLSAKEESGLVERGSEGDEARSAGHDSARRCALDLIPVDAGVEGVIANNRAEGVADDDDAIVSGMGIIGDSSRIDLASDGTGFLENLVANGIEAADFVGRNVNGNVSDILDDEVADHPGEGEKQHDKNGDPELQCDRPLGIGRQGNVPVGATVDDPLGGGGSEGVKTRRAGSNRRETERTTRKSNEKVCRLIAISWNLPNIQRSKCLSPSERLADARRPSSWSGAFFMAVRMPFHAAV